MSAIRFGLKVGGEDVSAADLRRVWSTADDAGFDHLWCLDGYASSGAGGSDHPIFEGWALQAAMAVSTTRARIGCTFTGNTHRPPWMLAKLAVTVDHLSEGRLEFGIGAGYDQLEHQMYDIDGYAERVGRLRESIDCMKLLWTEDRVTVQGRYYKLREAVAYPKPWQKPFPPIWIGAGGDQMLRVAAQHADVWHCPGTNAVAGQSTDAVLQKFKAASAKLDEICSSMHRDPNTIRRCAQISWNALDPRALVETCGAWLDVGCCELIVYLHPRELKDHDLMKAAVASCEILPELRKLD